MENTFQTEQQKKHVEQKNQVVLTCCVDCEHSLRLLQLRLISFSDLVDNVSRIIDKTKNDLDRLAETSPESYDKPILTKVE